MWVLYLKYNSNEEVFGHIQKTWRQFLGQRVGALDEPLHQAFIEHTTKNNYSKKEKSYS